MSRMGYVRHDGRLGQRFLMEGMSHVLATRCEVDRTADDATLGALSSRERDVAVMLAEGYSVLNVAARLGLGEGTVRNHVKRIHKKLGVTTRTELLIRLMGCPG